MNVYLEDSFVLNIKNFANEIIIRMDLVLTEGHHNFLVPSLNEQYCYREGNIIFPNIVRVVKFDLKNVKSYDLSLEKDMGNIDEFLWSGNEYFLSGDWGELNILSDPPVIDLGPSQQGERQPNA